MQPSNAEVLSVDDALTMFHDRWAGTSTRVFGRGRLADGRTSYDWVVEGATRGAVLDLGCGDGPALELLTVPAVGIDRNAAELAAAESRGLTDIDLVEGDARSLPFGDARFERIISHMTLMLVPDAELVAAEIDRVLAPGGTLRLVVSRRPESRPAAAQLFLDGLSELSATYGPGIDYPRSPWTAAAVRERLPGWTVEETPLELHSQIPVADVPSFLRMSYYNSGLLNESGSAALDELIARVVEQNAVGGVLPWTVFMNGLTARKPF